MCCCLCRALCCAVCKETASMPKRCGQSGRFEHSLCMFLWALNALPNQINLRLAKSRATNDSGLTGLEPQMSTVADSFPAIGQVPPSQHPHCRSFRLLKQQSRAPQSPKAHLPAAAAVADSLAAGSVAVARGRRKRRPAAEEASRTASRRLRSSARCHESMHIRACRLAGTARRQQG